jgi:ABC transporter substrate binding protein (PQQ-dependent alcohol dehydrogenase system)
MPSSRAWPLLAAAVLLAAARPAGAADQTLTIGYVEIENDPRYDDRRAAARYPLQPWGRPFDGARVALEESELAGAAAGVTFEVRRVSAGEPDGLLPAIQRLQSAGIRLVLLDTPGTVVDAVARQTRGRGLLLFNLTALDDGLRLERCQPHLFHVAPSHAMLMDALAQFLVARKWRDALVLRGPLAEDAPVLGALERAFKRFGVRVVATKPFVPGRDPRERARNNVALLTAGEHYDVVIVVDTTGELAREVPYQVQKPRPVLGAAGLVPDWWHWNWDRHGAPQLNTRFARLAKRPMTGYDWSAWMAVKAIVESVVRTRSTDAAAIAAYLTGDRITLDGFKGNRLSFRPWDRQLRQPLLLATESWVVERAPLQGFLHARNALDTLGHDERESPCRP